MLRCRKEQRNAIYPLFADLVGHKDLIEVDFSRASVDTVELKANHSTRSGDGHRIHKLQPVATLSDNRKVWSCSKLNISVKSFDTACIRDSIVHDGVPKANSKVTGLQIIELLLNIGVIGYEISLLARSSGS
jgi:hypothetical protein